MSRPKPTLYINPYAYKQGFLYGIKSNASVEAISFTRNSQATRVSNGELSLVDVNVPRLEKKLGSCDSSILFEPSGTNLITQSNTSTAELANTLLFTSDLSINGIAGRIYTINSAGGGANTNSLLYRNLGKALGTAYTTSYILRRADVNNSVRIQIYRSSVLILRLEFVLSTGRINTLNYVTTDINFRGGTIEEIGNGLVRISYSYSHVTPVGTNDYSAIQFSANPNGTSAWIGGAQHEQSPYVTSLIQTFGATNTRAIDMATLDSLVSRGYIGQANWSIYVDIDSISIQYNNTFSILEIDDVTGNKMRVYINTNDDLVMLRFYNSSDFPLSDEIQLRRLDDIRNFILTSNGNAFSIYQRGKTVNSTFYSSFTWVNPTLIISGLNTKFNLNNVLLFDKILDSDNAQHFLNLPL